MFGPTPSVLERGALAQPNNRVPERNRKCPYLLQVQIFLAGLKTNNLPLSRSGLDEKKLFRKPGGGSPTLSTKFLGECFFFSGCSWQGCWHWCDGMVWAFSLSNVSFLVIPHGLNLFLRTQLADGSWIPLWWLNKIFCHKWEITCNLLLLCQIYGKLGPHTTLCVCLISVGKFPNLASALWVLHNAWFGHQIPNFCAKAIFLCAKILNLNNFQIV